MICDLAETYHVLNYRELPPLTVAALVAGLGENSRIRRKQAGVYTPAELSVLALIYDKLSLLLWAQSKDGQKNRNKPESLYQLMNQKPKEKNLVAFDTGEDFDRARHAIIDKYNLDFKEAE